MTRHDPPPAPATRRWRQIIAGLLGIRPRPLQAGALCLRRGVAGPEVLLISSLDTGRWVIPKGWPMAGRSLAGAAMQEAWEEAGVRGRLRPAPVGRYSYEKRRKGGLRQMTEIQVFAIDVTDLAEDYPEAGRRQRIWLPAATAAGHVAEPGLQRLLAGLPP
ncbi:MAG TPA: NUDIX hydrolase [Paenirhodobacter sp.]